MHQSLKALVRLSKRYSRADGHVGGKPGGGSLPKNQTSEPNILASMHNDSAAAMQALLANNNTTVGQAPVEQDVGFMPYAPKLPMTLYKGVPEAVVNDIRKNGLKLGKPIDDNPPAVYFATTEERAHMWANAILKPSQSGIRAKFGLSPKHYAIVAFEWPPNNELFSLNQGEMRVNEKDFFTTSPIPAKYIKRITVHSFEWGGKASLTGAYYAVVPII